MGMLVPAVMLGCLSSCDQPPRQPDASDPVVLVPPKPSSGQFPAASGIDVSYVTSEMFSTDRIGPPCETKEAIRQGLERVERSFRSKDTKFEVVDWGVDEVPTKGGQVKLGALVFMMDASGNGDWTRTVSRTLVASDCRVLALPNEEL